ncbi:MAG: hypothetical protein GXN99_00350 [Candidatus Nanohaloarchaeota archaeon]|nr:hypothetical protein [Candidatus Nanohaloarchaeota archaeon]
MVKLKIYVLGNPLLKEDDAALRIAKELEAELKDVEFVEFDPAEAVDEKKPVFLDVSPDIDDVMIIDSSDDSHDFETSDLVTMHDYDLGVMLKLFREVGLLSEYVVIAVPSNASSLSKSEIVKKVKEVILGILQNLEKLK